MRFFSPFPHGTGSLSVSQEYLALPDGAGVFKQDFSGPALLNSLYLDFRVRDYHPLWLVFPGPFHYSKYSLMGLSAFARHYLRNQLRFLFLQVLRCFSSLGSLQHTMNSCAGQSEDWGCPIRKFTDQSLFATPRNISQRTTSFIASQCQGIHQMLLSRLMLSLPMSIQGV